MKKFFLVCLLFLASESYCQSYWQQEVNFNIQVELDDEKHLLRAFEKIEYVNNSPNSLQEIYMHIWPNAYRNRKTALGQQQHENGEDLLFKPADDIIGWIDSLDFKINGKPVSWAYDKEHQDICILQLDQPLASGERITITTPFKVKIPSGEISRLGHIGQSYQITQWYPKPAVYDQRGWNPIPYLNQGEFYSEYGSFDVSITLPKNYIVGATGDLQDKNEYAFLQAFADSTKKLMEDKVFSNTEWRKQSKEFPPSASETKTLRFVQKNVHDFAWFADKRYYVLMGEQKLPHSGKTVTSFAMFTGENAYLWKDAIEYLNDAIYYYSLWNGDYPYKQVTAVDGTISAGGGMEYPNVTVIGNSGSPEGLEIVIVHEVGHNWFYGILGSNERVHGWMDEGMNTLNEVRYVQTKYPDNAFMSDMLQGTRFHLEELSHEDLGDVSYRFLAVLGKDQPIETHSAQFTSTNYGIIMYQKTGLVFNYLRDYVGDERFDKAMIEYYNQWKFKHPQPEDMRASLEKSLGEDLGWLFDDLINTTNHVDYKIKSVKQAAGKATLVKVKNVGQVPGPIEVNAILGDSVVETHWTKPGVNKENLSFKTDNADYYVIDRDKDIPEINRNNNEYAVNKALLHRVEKPRVEFLIGDDEKTKASAFWSPIIGFNTSDKFMVGALLHNMSVPFNKFQYYIAPMYSVGRKGVSGIADIGVVQLPKKVLEFSKIGLNVKSFRNDNVLFDSEYYLFSPYWKMNLGNRKDNNTWMHEMHLQGLYRLDDNHAAPNTEHGGGFAKYDLSMNRRDHELSTTLRYDLFMKGNLVSENVNRASASIDYGYRYLKGKRDAWVNFRVYVGQVFSRTAIIPTEYRLSLSGASGSQDIYGENLFFGRSESAGLWSQQRMENMGGFRSTSWFGTTGEGLNTASITIQSPIAGQFISFFGEAGSVKLGGTNYTVVNTGASLILADFLKIHFPFWMNSTLEDSYLSKNYLERIRFTLNLNLLQQAKGFTRNL